MTTYIVRAYSKSLMGLGVQRKTPLRAHYKPDILGHMPVVVLP